MKNLKNSISFMNIITLFSVVLMTIFSIYLYKSGAFLNADHFIAFIRGFGVWAVLLFIIIQAVSIVISFIPTSIGCIAGIILFGPWFGFLYNYIGICVGSVLAFMLSKRYGNPLVKKIVSRKIYDKYVGWVENGKKFDKMFALAIFFPVAPDDFLCYLAGLTEMTYKKFISIIVLGKPVSLAAYSLGLSTIIHYATSIIK